MAKEENKLRIKSNIEKGNQQISNEEEIKKTDISKKLKIRNNIFINNYLKIIQLDVLLLMFPLKICSTNSCVFQMLHFRI